MLNALESNNLSSSAISEKIPCAKSEQWRFDYSLYLTSVSAFVRTVNKNIEIHQLNATEYRILIRLATHKGRLKAFELSNMLHIDPSTIAIAAANLENLGAIVRVSRRSDRRESILTITAQGIGFVREIQQLISPLMRDIWREIPSDLHSYVEACTLYVASSYDLFPRNFSAHPVDIALFEEMFITANLASHICNKEHLSLLGYRILMLLKNHPEGIRPSDIASILHTRANNITSTAKKLKGMGFVRQTSHPLDRRASILEITSTGWKIWSRVDDELYEFLRTGLLPDITIEDEIKHMRTVDALASSGFYMMN